MDHIKKRKRDNNNNQYQSKIENDQLRDVKVEAKAKAALEESKVENYLTKLQVKQEIHGEKLSYITIVLSNLEISRLKELNIHRVLIEKFKVKDVALSKVKSGVIDQFLIIYGATIEVSKAFIYLTYLINLKVNKNLGNDLYTLKSSNYKINVLLKSEIQVSRLKYFDKYRYDIDIDHYFIQGDFNSLFNMMIDCIENDFTIEYTNDGDNVFGFQLDPVLKRTSIENQELKANSNKLLLNFLYSN